MYFHLSHNGVASYRYVCWKIFLIFTFFPEKNFAAPQSDNSTTNNLIQGDYACDKLKSRSKRAENSVIDSNTSLSVMT